VKLPRRVHHPASEPTLVTSITVHKQKKNKFFAIVQTELGDAFKITLTTSSDKVMGMRAQLIDTLPVAASMNVTKMGLLFLAADFGDHHLYQLEQSIIGLPGSVESTDATKDPPTFLPRAVLQNMRVIDTLSNSCATTGLMVGEFAGGESSPQIYALCGRGPRSALRVMRHGAGISQLAVTDLPGTPSGLFTVRGSEGDEDDKYIVVSFADATLVLSVGESVEEVSDSKMVTDAPTISCSRLADGGIVQVHPNGIRHVKSDGQTFKDWQCPGLKKVGAASCNGNQVLVAYAGEAGEVAYFELDESMSLNLKTEKRLGAEVTCVDVGVVPKGRNRSMFAAVGSPDAVKVYSLSPHDLLSNRSTAAVQGRPVSACMVDMVGDGSVTLSIGTDTGIMQQTNLDAQSGAMSGNPTKRFLGAGRVEASRATVDGRSCGVMLSSRPWISFLSANTGGVVTAPLSYARLDHACGFASSVVSEGLVATSGSELHILTVEDVETKFNETVVPLRYTPRQMCLINGSLAIVEADARDTGEAGKVKLGYGSSAAPSGGGAGGGGGDGMDVSDDDDDDADSDEKKTPVRGPVPEGDSWGSAVRLIDPAKCRTLDVLDLEGAAALSCCAIQFASRGGEVMLAVGISKGLSFEGGVAAKEYGVSLYRVAESRLTLLHTTAVDGPVLSMTQFNSKLLVGVGGLVRLYDFGKKQLLRKCEAKASGCPVRYLSAAGDRVYVGTLGESVKILKFDAVRGALNLVSRDAVPRNITSMCVLDADTVCAADRFGNIFVLRSPSNAVEETLGASFWSDAHIPTLETLCHQHVGEVVTGMKRASLISGGQEAVIYTTITGKIGALLPLKNKDDVEFFTALQSKVGAAAKRPVGRDFAKYRGLYAPVKKVVDGDLVGLWGGLSGEVRAKIAEELDRGSAADVSKKIEGVTSMLM